MAQLVQKTAFTGGEIDQVLSERQNIEKVATGLETGRNVLIGKNALLERRRGTKMLRNARVNTGNTKLFSVPYSDIVVEFTENHIRIHKTDTGVFDDIALSGDQQLPDDFIPNLNVVFSNKFLRFYYEVFPTASSYHRTTAPCLYMFGMYSSKVNILSLDPNLVNPTLTTPVPLGYFVTGASYTVGTNQDLDSGVATQTIIGTANEVEYAATVVTEDGEESVSYLAWLSAAGNQLKQPSAVGDYVEITVKTDTTNRPYVTVAPLEYRFYRRPKGAGAFGYIGSSFQMTAITNGFEAKFRDSGQLADYSKNPPTYLSNNPLFYPRTGLMYQGRMLYGNVMPINKEYIFASRPNFPWNLSRSYPLSDDSALLFKSGQTGTAEVLHMVDMGTLVVFTSVGIYTQMQRGALTPTTAVLTYVNNSVADRTVPPIKFGDYLIFYDGTVKAIDFSNQRQNFVVEDISDFSGHLFKGRKVVSWATVKDPHNNSEVLYAVMDDGVVLTLTKNPKQELEAWFRHDFHEGKAIAVCGDIANSKLLFVIERDGLRTLEYLGDEYVDAYVTKSLNVAAQLSYPPEKMEWYFEPSGPDGFKGDLTLKIDDPTVPMASGFTVDKIYRMFDKSGNAYDIQCTGTYSTSPDTVTFKIYQTNYVELPEDLHFGAQIWETFTSVSGLSHLNDKSVSVILDGKIEGSPLNDNLDLPAYIPVGGSLTIPRAAFVTVGLPYVSDVGTTDVKSTQEVKISLTTRMAGKVYARTDESSRWFYAGAYFPEDDSVTDMKRAEEMFQNMNKRKPKIRTYEIVIPADWNNGARTCLRVVDPVPFRLLSIATAVNIA